MSFIESKSLAERAGIPISWNINRDEVIFDASLTVKETRSRLRGALRPVVPSDDACQPADAVQYWMYNGISRAEHQSRFEQLGIQYELTLMLPHDLGGERCKTLGHAHTFPPKSRHNYPEVCEVLWGEAIFIFQTLDLSQRSAAFCYAVHARPGDKVIFPPNLHHLTVNPLDEVLLFADLIDVRVRGNYDGLSGMQGAAHLYTRQGWVRNPTYVAPAPLTTLPVREYPSLGLTHDMPLYSLIWSAPEALGWLSVPGAFGTYFPDLWAMMPQNVLEGENFE
jgi:glucose-6-phosphate isomerase